LEPVVEYASSAVLQSRDEEQPPGGRPPTGRGSGSGKGRRRDPLWARLFVIFGALLMMASGGVIVLEKVAVAEATKGVNQQNLLGDQGAAANKKHVTINGAKNILLIGLDNRPGQNPTDLVRADSIIILHIAASHDRAYMVSIPRDTYVNIPAFPQTHFLGQSEKINAAFAFGNQHGGGLKGGVQLMAKTIKQLYGISFDAAAIVDFAGFQQVVYKLGTVCMYVDEKTTSVHIGHTASGKEAKPYTLNAATGRIEHKNAGVTPEVYTVGNHCFNYWQALDFVRQRELLPDGDYGRQRHQQQFIKAVFKKILSAGTLTNPVKLSGVLKVVGKAMTVDYGQGLSFEDWLFAMKGIGANDLVTIKTNNGGFHSEMINNQSVETLDQNTLDLLAAVRSDTVDAFVLNHPSLVVKSS
jgi:polyisoprenyl-teichoic acid--peptidoglycan teichoic acid transferase